MAKGKAPANKGKGLNAERVRDISVMVYKARLRASHSDPEKVAKEAGEDKLRSLAASYDPLTRIYAKAFGVDLA